MLRNGASIYDKNCIGDTPIYTAFKNGNSATESLLTYCCSLKKFDPKDKDNILHFHIACILDLCPEVRVFLKNGFEVNSPLTIEAGSYSIKSGLFEFTYSVNIDHGMTPLHFAAMHVLPEMVEILLENGADSNKADENGRTPLHSVLNFDSIGLGFEEDHNQRTNIVDMLLEKKARVDIADKNRCTPVHMAFYYQNLKQLNKRNIFIMLLPHVIWGSNNITDHQGLSYLHMVCTTNDVNQVRKFLNNGVNINSPVTSGIFRGYTPLHFAVSYNQKQVVELLLKSNAQVNINSAEMQVSPLHLACEYNKAKLIKLDAKFELIDTECQNQLSIIELLLLYGADIEIKNLLGETPLLHSVDFALHFDLDNLNDDTSIFSSNNVKSRLEKIIRILLLNKANVKCFTRNQYSILHILSGYRFFKVSDNLMELLLYKGLDINAVDHVGLTPLHVAINHSNEHMVQILLKYKANINAETNEFVIPLEISIKKYLINGSQYEKQILCTLLENGSEIDLITENNRTLLSTAIEKRNIFVVTKLLHYGADINFNDPSGESSVHNLYNWELFHEEDEDLECANLFQIIFIHVQKLLALGLHVSKGVLQCCTVLYIFYSLEAKSSPDQLINLDHIYNDCKMELDKMKLVKISNYTSLYSSLLKDGHAISKLIRNNSFIKIVTDQNLENKFPFYGYLLKIQFKKGLARSNALKFAKSSLDCIIGLRLPELCCDSVIMHLTNEEVANLKAAAFCKNSKF